MVLDAENTLMHKEAASASDVVAIQLAKNTGLLEVVGKELRSRPFRFVATCARGSSDHAATYAKYLIETHLKLVVASAAPSIASVYARQQTLEDSVFLAISQSGKSPDLLTSARAAKQSGAFVIAILNVEQSPLAEIADVVIPVHAGPENSVAATKTYISTLAAIIQLVAQWADDDALKMAVKELPFLLKQAWENDWSDATARLLSATNLFVVGRGLGFGIAQEAALKFKETCGLHAEAFSAAEVKHGPMAIVQQGFPTLIFSQRDKTRDGFVGLVDDFVRRGANVMVAGVGLNGGKALPVVETEMAAEIEPILFVQSFYRMVNALSVARGYNPDTPPHLNKVTETI